MFAAGAAGAAVTTGGCVSTGFSVALDGLDVDLLELLESLESSESSESSELSESSDESDDSDESDELEEELLCVVPAEDLGLAVGAANALEETAAIINTAASSAAAFFIIFFIIPYVPFFI